MEEKFYKKQILKSKRYKAKRDLLSVLLDEQQQYTHEEIEKLIEDFLNKEVE